MPTVTHDGRSFMIDGRRLWLVAGSMSYATMGRSSWASRIHAAKGTGLNALEIPIPWHRHEPRPGKFDFEHDLDLRYFVELVKHAGLYAILRLGPYVGEGWDLGGMPSWLLDNPAVRLRTSSAPFLEACSRFFTAVAQEVRDLQVTSPGEGGPVLLAQVEHQFTCGSDSLARDYLTELVRYVREAGLAVPIINSNNLWQGSEGEIDGWCGTEQMLSAMRQLATVRPTQPRVVVAFDHGVDRCWGQEDRPAMDPYAMQRRLAEILAGAGQFTIHPFVVGTNHAFWAGRSAEVGSGYFTPGGDGRALIDEAGSPTERYPVVRRLATFASRFAKVFANLEPTFQPVAVDPSSPAAFTGGAGGSGGSGGAKPKDDPAGVVSVVHGTGSQGSVAFVFADDPATRSPKARRVEAVTLLLPDGSTIPVPFGKQSVAWCVFGVHVSGRATVDSCSLCAFATLGQVFVCFGPAGAKGMLAVNGSPIEVVVPDGPAPLVVDHENLTLVVLSEELVDRTYLTDQAVFVGVQGVTGSGEPLPLAGEKSCTRIGADGKVSKVTLEPPKAAGGSERATLQPWTCATTHEYCDGTSPRYASIPALADLAALGCAYGYGWYRVTVRSGAARRAHAIAPQGGDRLHMYLDGEFVEVVGEGPGAALDAGLSLKKGDSSLVVLAENLGRYAAGAHMVERKGLYGPIWEFTELKTGKAKVVAGAPIELLAFRSPMWGVREGDSTRPERATWSIAHRKKDPLIVRFDSLPARALLVVNDKPVEYVDPAGPRHVMLDSEQLGRGTATVQLAFLPDSSPCTPDELVGRVAFLETEGPLTAKAELAFAKWEMPAPSMFHAPGRGDKAAHPIWWRSHFKVGPTRSPLYFDASGLTKGQLFVNGQHVSRYFVGTHDAKPVPPQTRYLIPDQALHHGRDNELTIFDEHGATPTKARLVYAGGASRSRA